MTSIANNITPARSQSFTYDPLNRISTANTQATTGTYAWGLNFGYDAWANLLSASVTQGSAYTLGVSIDPLHPSSNRLSGYSYDASGNMLNDGTNNYTFNAESEMIAAAGVTYTYDGDGNRVQKSNGKMYWNGGGSDPLDETDASGNLTDEYIFFGGKRIARRDPANNVDYYFADNLGTARIVTNASGAIQDDSDFYPFGGERPYLSSSGNTYKFTGKMRDIESGLDDFDARYYSSALGRFVSADWSATPEPVPYADFGDPQSLNLYTYVRNIPTTRVDADGHCDWCQKVKNALTGRGWQTDKEYTEMVKWYNNLDPGEKKLIDAEIRKGVAVIMTMGIAGIIATTDLPGGETNEESSEENVVAMETAAETGATAEQRTSAGAGNATAAEEPQLVAQNGTKVTGFTRHGANMAVGDGANRAGVKPEAILDALRNPQRITSGVDQQGRPFQVFTGQNARVVVNPHTGKVVSVNPTSGAGAH